MKHEQINAQSFGLIGDKTFSYLWVQLDDNLRWALWSEIVEGTRGVPIFNQISAQLTNFAEDTGGKCNVAI